jgi:hypothetical protein
MNEFSAGEVDSAQNGSLEDLSPSQHRALRALLVTPTHGDGC